MNAGTESDTTHEALDTSSQLSEVLPANLLIETWGFSRAITSFDMEFAGPNVKIEFILFAYASENSFNIDGGTE